MEALWYKDGLRFQCTECGKCCTGSGGYVYLSSEDIARLAHYHQLSDEQFCKKYTRFVEGTYALLDRPGAGDCIFLKENRCSVYGARPTQCRTFPWWIDHVCSKEAWEEAAKRCEGINHAAAPLTSENDIEEQRQSYLENLIAQNFDG